MDDGRRLEQLAAEARYHRQRFDLYRAKVYSGRATSDQQLRELQRASQSAAERLKAARAKTSSGSR